MSVAGNAYHLLTALAGPPLKLWLRARARRGKEIAARLPERYGIAGLPRPAGHLVWAHAASVGEAQSLLPLLGVIQSRGWHVLMTTGTVTSAELMAARAPAGVLHQFVPLDRRAWAKRFLAHWRPNLVLWAESELWPNLLGELALRQTPAVLVNGRLSDRAVAGWLRRPAFAHEVLATFRLVLAQSAEDRDRFTALGASRAVAVGNLKYAAKDLPAAPDALARLRAEIGQRPRWLAASIHPGEDLITARAHAALKARFPSLLTIAVPRHPVRGAEMAAAMARTGLKVARRGEGEALSPATDIYVADTMGELGLFYRLCDLVFMGKSLAVGGGQNPAEPAQIGCATLLGPDMANFRDMTAALVDAGAAELVHNDGALIRTLERLLGDRAARTAMAETGRAVVARHADALDETLAHLAPYLAATN